MDSKKDILWRVYVVYFLVCLFAVAIITKVALIQFAEGDYWKSKAENLTTGYKSIDAIRGNIYAEDGSLLATSIPIYEVRMDLNADALTDEKFNDHIDSLCFHLSELFKDKSQLEYKRKLVTARKNGERYHLIKRKVKYTQLKKMRQFPLFREGRYKGGFIAIQQNKRERPFRVLAARTIGYSREGVQPVGLEGAYNSDLSGIDGRMLMQKIAGGVWMPLENENDIEPEDGCDLFTNIDVNIQDVAENALLKQLTKEGADHGCVVLMEVATGKVKAIANLSKGNDDEYYEYYNYAIGESTEPGSTFKLASMIAALEDGYVDINDSIETGKGVIRFYDHVIKDSHHGGYGTITAKRVFEVSSNVGIAKIITENYSHDPQKFIDRLYKMNLNDPLGLEIAGEGKPYIKSTTDKSWSGISLPWISYGYETQLTPLQILTFYNAVANDGRMVKPQLVSQVKRRGKLVRNIKPHVINEAICSKETIKKVKAMLEGVVENGTAKNLGNAHFKIAGKTGTAQIANNQYGYKYDSEVSYQASFVGYFPAEAPKYSCIVVVNAPSKNVYYGNLVAGPIFKEIADKVYATSIEIHEELKKQDFNSLTALPVSKHGNKQDLKKVLARLNVNVDDKNSETEWTVTKTDEKKVELQTRKIKKNIIPNVVGMGAQDALYILENLGLIVELSGRGVIKDQSLLPGTVIQGAQKIKLQLEA